MRKGLVLINKHYILMQFIYLYVKTDDCKYDAVIELTENQKQVDDLFEKCKASGIFQTVRVSKNTYKNRTLIEKVLLFFRLTVLAITKKQHHFYQKILETDKIEIEKYDRIIVPNNVSFLSAALIHSADKKSEFIMLDEGVSDYCKKYSWVQMKDFLKIKEWTGFFMTRMGYANINWNYAAKSDCLFIKYCASPELLKYRRYKEIRPLFDFSQSQKEKYQEKISSIFSLAGLSRLKDIQAVICTSPLNADYCSGSEWFDGCRSWLEKELSGKKVLLKKHPRDSFEYQIEGIELYDFFSQIPGELIINELEKAEIVFLFPSTLLLNAMNQNLEYKIVYFDALKNEIYKKRFIEYCNVLNISEDRIIHL